MRAGSITLLLFSVTLLSGCNYLPDWAGGSSADNGPKLQGERFAALAGESQAKPDPSLASETVSLPQPAAQSDWPQVTTGGGNIAYGGSYKSGDDGEAGDGSKWEEVLIPSPVASSDTVFAMDAENIVSASAIDALDKRRWVSKELVEKNRDAVPGGGLALADGKLYATTGSGMIGVFDASNGNLIWKKQMSAPLRSAPLVADGRIIVMTLDNQTLAFSADKGELLWGDRGINEGAGYLSSVSPVIVDHLVLAPYSSGELHSLTIEDGKQLWSDSLAITRRTTATAIFAGIGANIAVADGKVFASSNSNLFAADDVVTGNRVWEQEISAASSPWVAGGYLYTLTSGNALLAVSTNDGRVKWSQQLPAYENENKKKDPITWNGPLVVQNKLVVVGAHGVMLILSPNDGSIENTFKIPSDVYTPPIVVGDRMILITKGAKLYSLR